MDETRGNKRLPLLVVSWIAAIVVVPTWMWFGAVGMWAMGQESLARTGVIGTPGTVIVETCSEDGVNIGPSAGNTDCAGPFTPDGGATSSERVWIANVVSRFEELPTGTPVTVRVAGGLAYEPTVPFGVWAGIAALGTGLFGAFPGLGLPVWIHKRIVGPDKAIGYGTGFAVAFLFECVLAYVSHLVL